MANRIFYQEDCNLGLLDGKTIAVMAARDMHMR